MDLLGLYVDICGLTLWIRDDSLLLYLRDKKIT